MDKLKRFLKIIGKKDLETIITLMVIAIFFISMVCLSGIIVCSIGYGLYYLFPLPNIDTIDYFGIFLFGCVAIYFSYTHKRYN